MSFIYFENMAGQFFFLQVLLPLQFFLSFWVSRNLYTRHLPSVSQILFQKQIVMFLN